MSHTNRPGAGQGQVSALCRAAGLSRSTFYRHRHLDEPVGSVTWHVRDRIQRIALEWPVYGYRRIHGPGYNARASRSITSAWLRLMRQDNLLCLRKRRFVRTTDSNHDLPVYPNRVPELKLTGIDQLWVA